jgi:four helix bundle protein
MAALATLAPGGMPVALSGGIPMSLPHQNLVAWERADDLFIEVHVLTHQRFPSHERFELGSQLRRAAFSVPANIVEGTAREHAKDKRKFFNVAAASLRELGYGLHAAQRLGYIDKAALAGFEQKLRQIGGPLYGLIAKYRILKIRGERKRAAPPTRTK